MAKRPGHRPDTPLWASTTGPERIFMTATAKNKAKRQQDTAQQDTPGELATPSDLKHARTHAVAQAINPLVADAFALYVKTKNYHWHMSGPHFRDYHLLLDEQAAQIFATIDPLAERVRKLSHPTLKSIGQISRLQRVQDNDADFVTPEQMLSDLMNENKAMAAHMREAHEVCDDNEDPATAGLLETFIDETERRTWFLFETLQGRGEGEEQY